MLDSTQKNRTPTKTPLTASAEDSALSAVRNGTHETRLWKDAKVFEGRLCALKSEFAQRLQALVRVHTIPATPEELANAYSLVEEGSAPFEFLPQSALSRPQKKTKRSEESENEDLECIQSAQNASIIDRDLLEFDFDYTVQVQQQFEHVLASLLIKQYFETHYLYCGINSSPNTLISKGPNSGSSSNNIASGTHSANQQHSQKRNDNRDIGSSTKTAKSTGISPLNKMFSKNEKPHQQQKISLNRGSNVDSIEDLNTASFHSYLDPSYCISVARSDLMEEFNRHLESVQLGKLNKKHPLWRDFFVKYLRMSHEEKESGKPLLLYRLRPISDLIPALESMLLRLKGHDNRMPLPTTQTQAGDIQQHNSNTLKRKPAPLPPAVAITAAPVSFSPTQTVPSQNERKKNTLSYDRTKTLPRKN